METGYIIVSAAITIVAFILFVISLYSYWRYQNQKLVFVMIVFFFFLIRGILLSLGVLFSTFSLLLSSYYLWIVDLVILTLLYAAALKR